MDFFSRGLDAEYRSKGIIIQVSERMYNIQMRTMGVSTEKFLISSIEQICAPSTSTTLASHVYDQVCRRGQMVLYVECVMLPCDTA